MPTRELPSVERQLDVIDSHVAASGLSPLSDAMKDMARAGIPGLAGGAQGLNPAVFMNNVPAPGTYAIDQQRFDLLTERNDVPQAAENWPGFGGRIDKKVANVGVLANIRLTVELSLVVSGAGAVTSLYPFPFNLLKKVSLNANGGSALINVEGLDLRARRNRLFRNPREEVATFPGQESVSTGGSRTRKTDRLNPGVIANGTYTVFFHVDLPIVHDPRTLTGALFAQSDQNYLNWVVETAQLADIFSVAAGGAVAITGTVGSTLTFYSIPSLDAQNGRIVVLPQAVKWLHEFIAQNKNFANTGDVPVPLIRNNGQLVAILGNIDNGGAAQIAPAALDAIAWNYAGNQTPRKYDPPSVLLEENQRDYDGLLDPGYFCLDFEKENPQRDLVYPRGLSELAVILTIAGGTTVNSNAHVHLALETLTTGG